MATSSQGSTPQRSLVLLDWATSPGQTPAASGSLFLDASVNEQHVVTANVTKHAVESGAPVSDYIRPLPSKVTLEVMITNAPTADLASILPMNDPDPDLYNSPPNTYGVAGFSQIIKTGAASFSGPGGSQSTSQQSYQALKFSSDFDRVGKAYDDLALAAQAGALFRITTSLKTYQGADQARNMAIVNFAVPRSAENGGALHGTIDFEEVRIVSTKLVPLAPLAGKKKNGQKAAKPPEPSEEAASSGSVLTNLLKSGGLIK